MTPAQDVLAANQAFYRAFEKMDIEAMGKVWSKGTDCICIHPGREAIRGWDQIRQSWDVIFKNTGRIELKTTVITTEVSDDLAYIVQVESLVQSMPQSMAQTMTDQPLEVQTLATNLFERMGSGWYIVHRHSSPVMRQGPPPPDAMQPPSPPPPGFLQGPN